MGKKYCPECDSTLDFDFDYQLYYCTNCGWKTYYIDILDEE